MLEEVVEEYLKLYPADRKKLSLLIKQVDNKEELDNRRNFSGHIAGDAIILSPDLKKILYVHHLRSGRWQQPGGHFDKGEEGPWLTAEREAYEETGVKITRRIGPVKSDIKIPLHIVTGPVALSAVRKEPHHWHHDFRYGFIAKSEVLGPIEDEGIGSAKWFSIDDALKIEDSGHEVQLSIERILSLL